MVETDHGTRHRGESHYRSDVQCDCHEVESHNRPRTDHERLGCLVGIRISQSMDQALAQIRLRDDAVHPAGKHRCSDLCCGLLQHRRWRLVKE